jgi:hypothetical protein
MPPTGCAACRRSWWAYCLHEAPHKTVPSLSVFCLDRLHSVVTPLFFFLSFFCQICIFTFTGLSLLALALSIHIREFFFASCVGANKQKNIPALTGVPLSTSGWRKFQIDTIGDHLYTCTVHSGVKKTHDWVVDVITDLFFTTHQV